ncbi:tyrosine-type recombinase/integrase [Streptomyces decoyicus]|uniref:tyrosine-type recombinase/integrase n=1 Tax=Streptomyces decoyicus TaxID=249567 RepID=UPI00398CCA2C
MARYTGARHPGAACRTAAHSESGRRHDLPRPFRKSWDRALKRLGLPGYNPHDLLHKWATVTLSNGVPIHEVSRWMGHSSIKITVEPVRPPHPRRQ